MQIQLVPGMDRRRLLVGTALVGALAGLPSANGLQTSGIESPRAAQEITRLKLDAAISISTIGSDNIFAAANNRAGDLIFLARPSLSAALSDSRLPSSYTGAP